MDSAAFSRIGSYAPTPQHQHKGKFSIIWLILAAPDSSSAVNHDHLLQYMINFNAIDAVMSVSTY